MVSQLELGEMKESFRVMIKNQEKTLKLLEEIVILLKKYDNDYMKAIESENNNINNN